MHPKSMLALPLALSLAAGAAAACERLEGAWELTYAIYRDQQGNVVHENKGDEARSLKILSPHHFSFITQGRDGRMLAAGAGTWSLDDDAYTEVVSYASSERLLGKTYRFDCEIRDGAWIHSGREDELTIEEHWVPASY